MNSKTKLIILVVLLAAFTAVLVLPPKVEASPSSRNGAGTSKISIGFWQEHPEMDFFICTCPFYRYKDCGVRVRENASPKPQQDTENTEKRP
ncbi:MAG: hypothetical protein GY765_05660 [bacterium]|nr:hypothetical protein [bacterium]